MTGKPLDLLHEGILQINTLCDKARLEEDLLKFYLQLKTFNPVYKLVSVSSEEEIITRHILDSLAPVEIIRTMANGCSSFADLGSGSGLPGLVLSCALDDSFFSLVDRMGRRAGFLRNTVAVLGKAGSVSIVERDVSELNTKFDAITFRAFRPLEDILDCLSRITHKDSLVFSYKSSEENICKEMNLALSSGNYSAEVVSYCVPFLDAKRSLLVLKRL